MILTLKNEVLHTYTNKVAGAVAICDHQKSKLRAVAGAEDFWVAELRVRQVKIGRKSCLDPRISFHFQILPIS